MARIADAHVSAMTSLPGGPVTEELAALGADAGLRAQSQLLDYVWRRHLRDAALRVVSAGGQRRGTSRAIGFADLVGFTALSQQLEDVSLAGVVNRFEEVAFDEVTRRGGRVVKMIGDEVMFVNDDALAAVDTGLALAEAYAADEMLSDVRVGIAYGSMLTREGDVYGPSVNLASRLVILALPGTVLVSDDARQQLTDDDRFVTHALRRRQLKDFGMIRPWVARRTGGRNGEAPPSHRRTTRLVRAPAPSDQASDVTDLTDGADDRHR
jgi:adenylate cyclase